MPMIRNIMHNQTAADQTVCTYSYQFWFLTLSFTPSRVQNWGLCLWNWIFDRILYPKSQQVQASPQSQFKSCWTYPINQSWSTSRLHHVQKDHFCLARGHWVADCPLEDEKCNVIQYWKMNQCCWPILECMVVAMLSMPSTSAPIKSNFADAWGAMNDHWTSYIIVSLVAELCPKTWSKELI